MAKLVDVPDLGSGAARRGGSSPSTRTHHNIFRLTRAVYSLVVLLNLPQQQSQGKYTSKLLKAVIYA
jgi:hypothetical protein